MLEHMSVNYREIEEEGSGDVHLISFSKDVVIKYNDSQYSGYEASDNLANCKNVYQISLMRTLLSELF